MDTGRLSSELTTSFRIVGTREWRLFVGAVLALCGYVLWVGATGAALSQIAAFANIPTTVDPWTNETTALAAFGILLWVILPAVAAVFLIGREITNVRDNLESYYRIHPLVLLAPPLALLAVGTIAAALLGEVNAVVLVVMLAGAVFFQIRAVVYSYRVFSLSFPRIQKFSLFLTSAVLSLMLLVEAAVAVGREQFMANAAAGFGDLLGVSGVSEFVIGTTSVAGISIPTLPAVTIATPLVLAGGYIVVQMLVGVVVRLRGNQVPRSVLRTGQRYPEFAQPTTNKQSSSPVTSVAQTTSQNGTSQNGTGAQGDSADGASSAASSADTTASAGATSNDSSGADADTDSEDDDGDADDENLTHTKVFTPPAEDGQTAIVGETASQDECPYCEAELSAGSNSCETCGASL